jgi:hypothetical protein
MRETFPTRLLLRVLQATPEELAAIERVLGGQGFPDRQPSAPPSNGSSQPAPAKHGELDQEERSIAAKVFELLTALDPDNRLRKAPPIKVFNLYYQQRLEPAEIARICKCHRSLIFDRLAAIQAKLPWTPQQLHELSPQVEAMQDALSDSRARDIHRKSGIYGGEDVDGESV